jgi:hypothetical protein
MLIAASRGVNAILSTCLVLLCPVIAEACSCLVSRSACREAANSNLVFIGTVESIRPSALNPWLPERPQPKSPASKATEQAIAASGLPKLRAHYLKLFSDATPEQKLQIQAATSVEQLEQAVHFISVDGTLLRFKVSKVFRRAKDDDKDDNAQAKGGSSDEAAKEKDKEEDKPSTLEIWNDAGSCAVPFYQGETYLVYAVDDEETGRMSTSICQRTARLSEAGDDLAYLLGAQDRPTDHARLEGFFTSDTGQLLTDRFHYAREIKSPVPGLVVQLRSRDTNRAAETDEHGHFVFDGLTSGDYEISGLDAKVFPTQRKKVAGPRRIHLTQNECGETRMLLINVP